MSIEKDVQIKIVAQGAAAAGDALKKIGDGARGGAAGIEKAQKSIGQLRQEALKASTSFGDLAKRIEDIDKRRAFQKMAADIKLSSRSMAEFKQRIQEAAAASEKLAAFQEMTANASGGAGGGSGGSSKSVSLLRRMRMARRVVMPIAHMFTHELGAVGSNMQRNALGMEREKGEGGFLMTTADHIRDSWSGRDMKEKQADKMREMLLWGQGNRFKEAEGKRGLADQMFHMNQGSTFVHNPFGAQDVNAEARMHFRNLELDRNRLGARSGGGVIEAGRLRQKVAGFDQTARTGGTIDEREGARTQAFVLAQKIAELEKGVLKDRKEMLQIDLQRKQIAEEMKKAAFSEIKNQREQFGELDAGQQIMATHVGKKLRDGVKLEDLDAGEREAAEHIGVLQPLLRAAKAKKVNEDGSFAQFAAATGSDAVQKAAEKSLKVNGGVNVELFLDEAKLVEQLKGEFGGLIRDLKATVGRVADDLAADKLRNHALEQGRAAANVQN